MGIKKGFSTLEILISLSVLVILITLVVLIIFFTFRQIIFYQKFLQASYLAQEGQEIARKDKQEQEEQINGFLRTINLEAVFRDNEYNISEFGDLDQETIKVIVRVFFDNHEVKLINYLTNWHEE
ncbi:MAG: type II secretion system protein [Candidatus Pacebacteria bacterium]|nr:type II secretion system protein [Candidatus Paceibacterota bacterium]